MITYCVKRDGECHTEIIEGGLTFESALSVRDNNPDSWIEEDEDFYIYMEEEWFILQSLWRIKMNNIIVGVLCVFIYILLGMGMLSMYLLFHYQNKPKLYKRLLVIIFWPVIYL